LSWPLVASLGSAAGVRGDYYNNLWNAWWLEHCVSEGVSPYWTDHLYYPEGISLRRHTLSPLNAASLVLFTRFLGPHQAFSLLILLHFALSAWCFSLFARAATGSTAGGVLGGLVYSFAPFHYFYLCQINVFSFEFLPLALLFFVKHGREGGRANLAGAVGAVLGMGLTLEYYVVYAYLALGVLLLCKRGWAREVPWAFLLRRWALAGGVGAVLVAAAAFPLLVAALTEGNLEAQTSANVIEKNRFNDLLGFFWIGGDEELTVSWPTMLGYSTLALCLVGWRRVLRLWPWLAVGAVFLVLSLGEELAVARQKTGIPLPYALLKELPVLSMLRKSDRCFMLVQVVAALSLAAAWPALAERLRSGRARAAGFVACAALTMGELTAVPLGRFALPTSPYLETLRADASVEAVMELPPMPLHVMNGRFDYYQTLHEKKTTLGYTTSIALQPHHDERLLQLANLYLQFIQGHNRALPRLASDLGVQRVLHYKSYLDQRPKDPAIDGLVLWRPFVFWRRPLVYVRQVGEYVEKPYPAATWRVIRMELARSLGEPLFEDELMAVFPVPERP
ncbi:MAG TPA: hypothetical protein VF530_08740, partial [Planctomycetota bacterium]